MEKGSVKNYLTPNEASELLMVSPITLRQWAQKGMLKAMTTAGGHRRFLISDIKSFARERGITLLNDSASSDKLRVLVVDDDPQLVSYLTELLGTLTDEVILETANDGFDAGRKIYAFQPHLILLDLMMPGLNGFEVCERVKSDPNLKSIRVITMTGYAGKDNIERAMAAGAEACLAKPVDVPELLEHIGVPIKANQATA